MMSTEILIFKCMFGDINNEPMLTLKIVSFMHEHTHTACLFESWNNVYCASFLCLSLIVSLPFTWSHFWWVCSCAVVQKLKNAAASVWLFFSSLCDLKLNAEDLA